MRPFSLHRWIRRIFNRPSCSTIRRTQPRLPRASLRVDQCEPREQVGWSAAFPWQAAATFAVPFALAGETRCAPPASPVTANEPFAVGFASFPAPPPN